jgi:hypothetical protein
MGVTSYNFESIVKDQGPHHEMWRNVVNVDPNIIFLQINYIRLIIYCVFKSSLFNLTKLVKQPTIVYQHCPRCGAPLMTVTYRRIYRTPSLSPSPLMHRSIFSPTAGRAMATLP